MTPLRPEARKPQPTFGSILAGLAVGCMGLVILVPAGLCTSFFGISSIFGPILGGIDDTTIPIVIACIPAVLIAYFVVRTAIRIGRGE